MSLNSFDRTKVDILKDIQSGVDWSPKGSIDAPVRELVAYINNLPDYVTTSSCSGRISCFRDDNRTKGIEWLLVKHRTVTLSEVYNSVQVQTPNEKSSVPQTETDIEKSLVMLKCEPFILHVQCRSVTAAQQLHRVGMGCGFRESGIGLGQKKTMVAIRTSALSMELPVAIGNKFILDDSALRIIVSECNRKLCANFSRIDRLLQKLKEEYVWPVFQLEPFCLASDSENKGELHESPYSDQAFYGHSAVVIPPRKVDGSGDKMTHPVLISLGGSGKTGRNIRPHSITYASDEKSRVAIRDVDISTLSNCIHSVTMTAAVCVEEITSTPQVSVVIPAPKISSDSMNKIKKQNQIVIVSGGRTSPLHALPAVSAAFLLDDSKVSSQSLSAVNVSVTEKGDIPEARWGHTVVPFDSRRWLLAGGRDGEKVFGDAYIMELIPTLQSNVFENRVDMLTPQFFVTLLWTKLQHGLPSPRFFHAMCNTQNACAALVVHGGLGEAALSGDVSSVATSTDAYVLTLPSFAANCNCLYDEVDDVCVETCILASKLQWRKLNSRDLNKSGRFGHTLTYIGANSIAIIGGSTFNDDTEESVVCDSNTVEIWDLLVVDPSVSCSENLSNDSSWNQFCDMEVYCDFTAHSRIVAVECPDSKSISLELGMQEKRSHHQSLLQESLNPLTRTIETRLMVTGGGLDCPALFGSCFSPPLSLCVSSQSQLSSSSIYASTSNVVFDAKNDKVQKNNIETVASSLVVLIPSNRVRGLKVFLDNNKWLDKTTRISVASTSSLQHLTQVTCTFSNDEAGICASVSAVEQSANGMCFPEMMAVPVNPSFYEMMGTSPFGGKTSTLQMQSSLSVDHFEVLYGLLVTPIPDTTLTASERKKLSKKSRKKAEEPVIDAISHSLKAGDFISFLFAEQECSLNKTKIASMRTSGRQIESSPSSQVLQPKEGVTAVHHERDVILELLCDKTSDTSLVILVPKSRVRGVKVFLDSNKWLDKSHRISSANLLDTPGFMCVDLSTVRNGGETDITSDIRQLSSVSNVYSNHDKTDMMAIPVTSEFYKMLSKSDSESTMKSKGVIIPFSADLFAALYSLLVLPIPETTLTASERKKKGKVKASVKEPVMTEARDWSKDGHTHGNMSLVFTLQSCTVSKIKIISGHLKAVEYLKSFVPSTAKDDNIITTRLLRDIPTKFEIVGDVIMIPEGSLESEEWENIIDDSFWIGLLNCFSNNANDSSSTDNVRKFTRVARKARIDPGLKRESRVRLLFPSVDSKVTDMAIQARDCVGPGGDGWTEVIENGITFGFDITKVM